MNTSTSNTASDNKMIKSYKVNTMLNIELSYTSGVNLLLVVILNFSRRLPENEKFISDDVAVKIILELDTDFKFSIKKSDLPNLINTINSVNHGERDERELLISELSDNKMIKGKIQ